MGTATARSTNVHRGVPTFFRACVWEARQGGKWSYYDAGWALLHNVPSQVECNTAAEQDAKLGELAILLNEEKEDRVLNWFTREFPACLALVPARRRENFVRGVFDSWDHEGGSF